MTNTTPPEQPSGHQEQTRLERFEDLYNHNYLLHSFYIFIVGLLLIGVYFTIANFDAVQAKFDNFVNLLMPFIWGICIAYVLMPLLNHLERLLCRNKFISRHRNICRAISITITLLIVSVILGIFFSLVIPELINSIMSLFNILTNSASYDWIEEYLQTALERLAQYGITEDLAQYGITQDMTLQDLPNTIIDSIQNPDKYVDSLVSTSLAVALKAGASAKNILLAIIVSIYLMIGKETFLAQTRKIVYACATRERAEHFLDFCRRTNRIFSGFISGKLLDSLIIGILCFILMNILHLEYTMLISLIVGVTNVIPFFGPFIGAIPSILLLLIVSPRQALIFLVLILALQQFDGNILGPKILGDSTGLTSFWVIFAVIVMGGMLGTVGMFIGVPIFATIYMVTRNFAETRLRKKNLPTQTKSYHDIL